MLETPGQTSGRPPALPISQEVMLTRMIEQFSRDRTFESLYAALGEDKAKGVIVNIGQAALSAVPELRGGALGAIVAKALAILSPQDWAAIARGDSAAIGRAQTIVQEEVKAQKNAALPAQNASSIEGRHGGLADYASFAGLAGKSGMQYNSVKDVQGGDAVASQVTASSFAKSIGADPALTGFFVGASQGTLQAISAFIRDGKAIEETDIKTLKDARAVIGAIRAGKIDPNDPRLPDSVKKIIADMKKEGIDPATADKSKIDDYFKRHPDALKVAKKANAAAIEAKAGQTEVQVDNGLLADAARVTQNPASPPAAANTQTNRSNASGTQQTQAQQRRPRALTGDT